MSPGLNPFRPYSWPYSAKEVPSSVIRPILFVPFNVNQIAPSGPVVIPSGALPGGSSHSLQTGGLLGVSRPTLGGLAPNSVNHRFPSGPAVISPGELGMVGIWYSVMAPPVVMRPILWPFSSVNQSAPSGPTVIPAGWLFGVGTTYS